MTNPLVEIVQPDPSFYAGNARWYGPFTVKYVEDAIGSGTVVPLFDIKEGALVGPFKIQNVESCDDGSPGNPGLYFNGADMGSYFNQSSNGVYSNAIIADPDDTSQGFAQPKTSAQSDSLSAAYSDGGTAVFPILEDGTIGFQALDNPWDGDGTQGEWKVWVQVAYPVMPPAIVED